MWLEMEKITMKEGLRDKSIEKLTAILEALPVNEDCELDNVFQEPFFSHCFYIKYVVKRK